MGSGGIIVPALTESSRTEISGFRHIGMRTEMRREERSGSSTGPIRKEGKWGMK